MYKRKDNDIFGTANIGYAPRIENDIKIDPNAAFKKRTQQNYQRYQAALITVPQTITAKPLDSTRVNQAASFEEDYHRNRKEMDMQSSIFYPPITKPIRKGEGNENDPTVGNQPCHEVNYGRKQVFKRQISGLPLNNAQIRGNSSRLFDLDERIKSKSEINTPLMPLIPHQMQWDQHDSVKYSHINFNPKKEENDKKTTIETDVMESKSTVFSKEDTQPITQIKPNNKSIEKKPSTKQQQPPAPKLDKDSQSSSIQVHILKGWNHKFMQGLSKHCKLNNSAILSFQVLESKVQLTLKKSQRWENVVDWLRKDCKLKLRVMN